MGHGMQSSFLDILGWPKVCLGFCNKEIKPVNPKGNQSPLGLGLGFTGRPDAEAKASILWPPDARSQLIRKDPDAGKD